jgi:muramoyltetrapeptide carboxypeptidase
VRRAAKPLVGYSDVTALLLWQRRCAGLVGFHGPMLDRGADVDADAFAELMSVLAGRRPASRTLRGRAGGGGRASGRLIGGSLTLVAASLGTPWEVDTRGAILLLEDVGERPYRIDRMLRQLAGAGKLRAAAGIGLGDFASCRDDRYPTAPVERVLEEVVRPLGVPWVTGLPFGHVACNRAWPVGGRATIDGRRGELHVVEQGVSRAA